MTATAEAPTSTRLPPAAARAHPLRRHAAVLGLLLVALLPWLGSSRVFSADESAVEAQAHLLAHGDGWFIDHVRTDLDPDGRHFLIHQSATVGDHSAPFAKHPVYAVALAPLERLGGKTAMVLSSMLGTVLAAWAAALLASRVRPGTEVWTFWAVGLASPAFLFGYVLIAHTLAAALAGLAVYLAVRDRPGWRDPAGVALALVLCVTLRSEALLLGLALSVATVLVARIHRTTRYLVVAAAAGVGAIGGAVLDRLLAHLVAAGQVVVNAPAAGSGSFLGDRVFATALTWLVPTYDGLGVEDLLLAGVALFGVLTVVVARKRPEDVDGQRLFAALAVACAVARLFLPSGLTPGLLVAFPLLTAGFAALDGRRIARNPAATVATATFALFALAVLATQYREGGSTEWGGRYFLIGLPVIVPVAVAALADLGDRLDGTVRRRLLAAAVAVSVVMAANAGLALFHRQWTGQHGVDALDAAAAAQTDPVVLVTDGNAGRRAWPHVVAGEEWLLSDGEEDLPALARTLASEGRPLVVSTLDEDQVRTLLDDSFDLVDRDQATVEPTRVVLSFVPR